MFGADSRCLGFICLVAYIYTFIPQIYVYIHLCMGSGHFFFAFLKDDMWEYLQLFSQQALSARSWQTCAKPLCTLLREGLLR